MTRTVEGPKAGYRKVLGFSLFSSYLCCNAALY